MGQTSQQVPPVSTFVVRFWREWSDSGQRWRGRVEHLQSGSGTDFLDLSVLLDFIRGFEIMHTN